MTSAPVDCTPTLTRFTAQERALIRAGAARTGLPAEEFIRTCMGYGYPKSRPQTPRSA